MEAGFVLTVPARIGGGVRWSSEPALNLTEFSGELIVPQCYFGGVNIAGYRCRNCRLLVLTY